VTIGEAGAGSSLGPGGPRAVTFAHRRTVTIAPGQDVLSDAVTLNVEPFQRLAISVYVPGTVDTPTEHFFTRQRSYMTPPDGGDHSQDRSSAASTRRSTTSASTGWYFLDGLDVEAAGDTGAVVTFGDSITDGFQGVGASPYEQLATIDRDSRYPDDLARRLIAAQLPLSVLNAGITGNRLLDSASDPTPWGSGVSRFSLDALTLSGVSDVIVLEGINDIFAVPQPTAEDLITGYEALIRMAHAAGVHIQLGTLTPGGWSISSAYAPEDRLRQAINQWIRTQHLSDGIVDFDAAVRDPANPYRLRAAYDGGDQLHLSPVGYDAMAGAVALSLLHRPGCLPALRIRVTAGKAIAKRVVSLDIMVSRPVGDHWRPAKGVLVSLNGDHGSTNRRGRTVLRVRLPRVGVYSITAGTRGLPEATLAVRAAAR
jgi:lysophospholipase L1-like esterase